MATTLPTATTLSPVFRRYGVWLQSALSRRWLSFAPLVAVVAVSLVLNTWQLSKAGFGNTYYAAATRSMTLSWKNFFFGALDPGGFITVDKPPVFLWIDALSARIFGYSTLSILLPSAIAGVATVALVWLMLRRYFGEVPATIGALVLALTPISVAVYRLNLPEPFYILALVGAAYAVLLSFDSKRWWVWTLVAGVLVGVAFNTKMLAGWIPGPALALAIVAGFRGPWQANWRQCVLRLGSFGLAALVVSASWLLVVDAWPKSDRPYIGGSSDNSVLNLALDYNGLGRVEGDTTGFDGASRPSGNTPPAGSNNGGGFNTGRQPNGGFTPGATPNVPNPPGGGLGGARPGGNAGNNAGGNRGPGGIIAGRPGLFRMFDPANGGQIAWFLPLALLGGLMALWHWRKDSTRRGAVVLGLGWTLVFGLVFSYTKGIYHSYYTSAMAPGIGLLAGMSVLAIAELVRRHAAWAVVAGGVIAVTLWTQLTVAGRVTNFNDQVQPVAIVVVVAAIALLALTAARRLPVMVPLTLAVVGLLLLPGAWSRYETVHASLNATLPQAGPRLGLAGSTFGSNAFDNANSRLATWLNANEAPNVRWDLAVSSAQTAATLIAANHLSVMAIGGFTGSDPTLTASDFASLVAQGEVRYVLVSGGGPGGFAGGGNLRGGPAQNRQAPASNAGPSTTNAPAVGDNTRRGASSVFSYVQSACVAVTDTSLPSQYRGSLFDCVGLLNTSAAP